MSAAATRSGSDSRFVSPNENDRAPRAATGSIPIASRTCDGLRTAVVQAEPLPAGAVHPVAEALIAGSEVETAEQGLSFPGIVVKLPGGGRFWKPALFHHWE